MWLSDRRRTLALGLGALALILAGCAFSPAYGPGTASSKLQSTIFIPAPGTEDLYQAVQNFEQKMGRASEASAKMRLAFSVSKSRSALGATASGSITRYHWSGTLTYTLVDVATGSSLASGDIKRFTAYSATGNIAATLAAERDATRRLMVILSDALIDRLVQIDPASLP